MKVWIIEEVIIRGREPESNIVFVGESFLECVGWLDDHNLPHKVRGDDVYVSDGVELLVTTYGDEMLDDRQIRIVADHGDVWFVTCHEVK